MVVGNLHRAPLVPRMMDRAESSELFSITIFFRTLFRYEDFSAPNVRQILIRRGAVNLHPVCKFYQTQGLSGNTVDDQARLAPASRGRNANMLTSLVIVHRRLRPALSINLTSRTCQARLICNGEFPRRSPWTPYHRACSASACFSACRHYQRSTFATRPLLRSTIGCATSRIDPQLVTVTS
jgi:hypothetical protein